jgi:alpha-L-fucosidase
MMARIRIKEMLLAALLVCGASAGTLRAGSAPAVVPGETVAQRNARMAWWSAARFGMFIHWDMSCLAGTEISWSRKGSKPRDIYNEKAGYVEDPVYDHLYEKFNPTKFDAKEWVKVAQDAGMKYMVITAKHHGGFCMWDTKLTDYSIMHTPFHRDVIKELSDACHEAGLRFGVYYSPRDWHHPDYGIGDDSKYLTYMEGQLTELLTNYGKIDVVWFDSFGQGDSNKYWHAGDVLALVRRLQPETIINNRCNSFANSTADLRGDFDTPEGKVGTFQNNRAWESCMCIVNAPGGGWSYRPDGQVKSFADCIHTLASCATGDGNLLLDVGPNPLGEIPADQTGRLAEVGQWMKKCSASIYGTRGGPYRNGRWGGSTYKDNTVYLHLFKSCGDKLELPNLNAKILKCSNLGTPDAVPTFAQTDAGIVVTLPADRQDKADTVVALQLDGPVDKELSDGKPLDVLVAHAGAVIPQAADGSITLTAACATVKGREARLEERGDGPNIGYWSNAGDSVSWKASIKTPGTFSVELMYACQGNSAGSQYSISAGKESITGKIEATGSFEDYRTVMVGTLKLDTPGVVAVTLQPTSKPGPAVMNLRQVKLTAK